MGTLEFTVQGPRSRNGCVTSRYVTTRKDSSNGKRPHSRGICPTAGGLPAFAEVVPEIPFLMIHIYRCYVIWSKRNVSMPTHVYDATFAGDHLIEALPIPEPDRNNLITGSGFALASQIIRPFAWYWN